MYLHLLTDNFIVDSIIENCEKCSNENRFVVFTKKSRFVQSGRAEFFDSYRQLKESGFKISQYKRIYIHYLGGDSTQLVLDNPHFGSYYWFFWGADGYALDELKKNLFLPRTRQAAIGSRKFLPYLKKRLRQFLIPVSNRKKVAIKNIQYCCTWVDGDYERVKAVVGTSMKQMFFTYQSVNQLLPDKPKIISTTGLKKILAGNSLNPSNNHFEIIDFLQRILIDQEAAVEVVMPLSYSGRPEYAAQVKAYSSAHLKEITTLDDFMDRSAYQEVLESVDVAIFFHLRQQASNTALALLWLGKILIMQRESTLFEMFNKWGLSVVAHEAISSWSDLVELDKQWKDRAAKNQTILFSLFSDEAVLSYYKSIYA